MKKLIILIFFIISGCVHSPAVVTDEAGKAVQPFMDKTTEEDRLDVAVPVYKF